MTGFWRMRQAVRLTSKIEDFFRMWRCQDNHATLEFDPYRFFTFCIRGGAAFPDGHTHHTFHFLLEFLFLFGFFYRINSWHYRRFPLCSGTPQVANRHSYPRLFHPYFHDHRREHSLSTDSGWVAAFKVVHFRELISPVKNPFAVNF